MALVQEQITPQTYRTSCTITVIGYKVSIIIQIQMVMVINYGLILRLTQCMIKITMQAMNDFVPGEEDNGKKGNSDGHDA